MSWFWIGLASLVLAAALRLALPPRPGRMVWLALFLVGGGATSAPALQVIGGHPAMQWSWETGFPGGPWLLRLDALAAWFVPLIVAVGLCAALYAMGITGARARREAMTDAMTALLVAAMLLVVTAQAVVPFLVAWEGMAIAGLLLILHDGERPDVRRSALVYLVATHVATLALTAMFALWGSGAADLTFPSLASALRARPQWAPALLLLGLLGFGLKAGVVPFHSWLPGAHASAPSQVSAVLSGVMIKIGVYGILRLTFMVEPLPAWWGWLLLAVGIVSGVLGVLWALAQHDLKRLLAYHSVENIGIILIGVGAGAIGAAHGRTTLAVLGYAGALLHTVNHALFKSALFLGSGAIARASGTREIDALGGLARRMPWTWGAFLIASLAIVGLPPLNGFVSEWTIVLALLSGLDGPASLRALSLAAVGLGLMGALALACFAKVDGVSFLGTPRSAGARDAREVGAWLLAPPILLAIACVVLGFLPSLGLSPAIDTAASTMGTKAAEELALESAGGGATRISWLALTLIATTLAAVGLRAILLARRPATLGETWSCAYPTVTPHMQYTAASFAAPLLGMFRPLSGVTVERTREGFHTHPMDLILDRAVRPLWDRLQATAARMRTIQSGRLHWYLLYVLATLGLLLAYLASWGTR